MARGRASVRGIALLAAAFTVQATSGCISNEYRIQNDELRRVAELPPETRGHAVRVSQQLGSRREDALEEPVGYTPNGPAVSDDVYVQLDLNGTYGGEGPRGPASSPSLNGTPPTTGGPGTAWRGTAPTTGWRGTPPSTAGPGTPPMTWKGTPPGATAAKGGFHGTPSSGGGSGGGGFNFSGGSGNGGDALAVLAVVLIVSAAVGTVALAASEGMRFEGHADLAPEQTVHLVYEGNGTRDVQLGALTTQDLAGTKHALVMDDEGYGMRRLDHAPLDRHGGVFRFELGAGRFNFGDLRATGFTSNIGAGYFPTSHFGLLLDLGLGSGSVDSACCVGPAWTTSSIGRYSVGLEAQAFPVNLGPLHLGAFGGGGFALVGPAGARESGPQASGGALLELDLTSHMALTVRGGASAAHLPGGWSSGGALTGGLSIY
jgi:hypothetical protein